MATINYTITFYSPWHCGSGTSAGADVDELTIKDAQGMPFIPGKTLKGLIREAVEDYARYTGNAKLQRDQIEMVFGSLENCKIGMAHFTDAFFEEKEYQAIVSNNAQSFLFKKLTTTSIGENGIAREHSLRSLEVTVPCTLYASIIGVPADACEMIEKSFGFIKRLGQKRNRGLGRCDFKKGGE